MSDFIEVLAAQASGGPAAVLPRLPARFDPSALVPTEFREQVVEVVTESAQPEPQDAAPPSASAARTAPTLAPLEPPSPRAQRPEPIPTRTQPVPAERGEPSVPPVVIERTETVESAPVVVPATPAPAVVPATVPPVASDNAPPASARPAVFAPAPIVTRSVSADVAPSKTEEATQNQAVVSQLPAVVPISVARTVPRAEGHRPPDDRADSPRADAVLATHTEPTAPTISVTIGRVEVRAVLPAPAPPVPPPAPRAPRMTLDDYLKRTGGQS
jgi:hypothetical protein